MSRTGGPLSVYCLCSDRFYNLHFIVEGTDTEMFEETLRESHGWGVTGAEIWTQVPATAFPVYDSTDGELSPAEMARAPLRPDRSSLSGSVSPAVPPTAAQRLQSKSATQPPAVSFMRGLSATLRMWGHVEYQCSLFLSFPNAVTVRQPHLLGVRGFTVF